MPDAFFRPSASSPSAIDRREAQAVAAAAAGRPIWLIDVLFRATFAQDLVFAPAGIDRRTCHGSAARARVWPSLHGRTVGRSKRLPAMQRRALQASSLRRRPPGSCDGSGPQFRNSAGTSASSTSFMTAKGSLRSLAGSNHKWMHGGRIAPNSHASGGVGWSAFMLTLCPRATNPRTNASMILVARSNCCVVVVTSRQKAFGCR